jgi:uncharacterized protein YndB with AHSA1/START domain
MANVSRSRTIAAAPETLWKILGDPHHLPRWWPMVERVENVKRGDFTSPALEEGRTVRQDFHTVANDVNRRREWSQDLAGTPFERFLAENTIEVTLAPAGDATKVTLESRQKLKGMSRMGGGGFMLRRATRKQLDEALERLEGLL